MHIEWWFDDATFASSGERELYLARQVVGDDGTAEVLLASGERLTFPDEEQAHYWLADEEYRRIDALYDDMAAEGRSIPTLDLPADDEDEASLLRKMHVTF